MPAAIPQLIKVSVSYFKDFLNDFYCSHNEYSRSL